MRKVKIISAKEAAMMVEDGMTVSTNGFVACDLPEELTSALEQRFLETGSDVSLCGRAGKSGWQRCGPFRP